MFNITEEELKQIKELVKSVRFTEDYEEGGCGCGGEEVREGAGRRRRTSACQPASNAAGSRPRGGSYHAGDARAKGKGGASWLCCCGGGDAPAPRPDQPSKRPASPVKV